MRLIITFLLFLLLPPLVLPASGAPPKMRPYAGSGLLLMRPPTHHDPGRPASLVVFREPGIGRIAEPGYGDIPLLRQVVEASPEEYPVAVMGKKGTWLKISYDDAGRSGWIEGMGRWDYIPWEELLPGRPARLLPGLKKSHYHLRRGPSAAGRVVETMSLESVARIDRLEGDWAHVTVAPDKTGWIRWRDTEGRFLITVRPVGPQQIR
jgi:Bacterial SH3 domain